MQWSTQGSGHWTGYFILFRIVGDVVILSIVFKYSIDKSPHFCLLVHPGWTILFFFF